MENIYLDDDCKLKMDFTYLGEGLGNGCEVCGINSFNHFHPKGSFIRDFTTDKKDTDNSFLENPKEEFKIVQISSFYNSFKQTTGIIGLGNDNNVYFWDELYSKWRFNSLEVKNNLK
jgi:hypothetical protein